MSSGSPSPSKEFNSSHLQQQSLQPIIPQSNPPIQPTPKPDPANPLVIDDEDQHLNPEISSSLLSVEVSVGPSVSFVSNGMMTSPTTSSRRTQKRKKAKGFGSFKKKQAIEKKLQTLAERLNLVPFIPKSLDLAKHEVLFKSLGLWDFVSIVMGSDFNDIRSYLVSQLIATYDSKSRGSYVNEVRIKVNRADLARAFKLPVKKEKTGATDVGDMDLTGVSCEGSVAFLLDFVTSWVVLNNDEEVWIMPDDVAKLIKPIEEGHPEQMDWSTLLWSMVEQELAQGEQLEQCYYAAHLQHLIRSQREDLLSMELEEGVTSQETRTGVQDVVEKKDDGDEEEVREVKGQDEEEKALTKDDVGDEEEVSEINGKDNEEKVMEKKDDGAEELVLEVKGQASVETVLEKNDNDELLEKVQDKEEEIVETDIGVKEEILVTEDGISEHVVKMNDLDGEEELLEEKDDGEEESLEKKDDGDEEKLEKKDGEEEVLEKDRHNNVEILEMKDDVEEEMLDSKEEEELEQNVNGKEGVIKACEVGGPRVELTLGQELITEVASKDADMVDLEVYNYDHERQWLLNGKSNLGGHFLQRCSTRGNMVSSDCIEETDGTEEGEEDGIEAGHDFDVLPTAIDDFEGEGLDGNFLGAKLSYGSHASLGHHSSVDIMDSQMDMHESGPSFYHNNGKRKVHDDAHISRHGNDNKRFRTEQDSSYRQPEDFGTIMEQMQFFMDKAKTKYMEKEQEQEQTKVNQQLLFDELQKRDAVIESLQQVKQEEIEKRDLQIYRLNRELFLMCTLLDDYKKALKKTDKAFDEYRRKNQQIPEEPMYKDAGNGLVLSIADIDKQRQIEEEKLKSEIEQKAKEAEEGYTLQFEEFMDKVNGLDTKLSVIENDFKSLEESYSRSKLSETSVPSVDD